MAMAMAHPSSAEWSEVMAVWDMAATVWAVMAVMAAMAWVMAVTGRNKQASYDDLLHTV